MKHPVYYIIVATVAVVLSIWLLQAVAHQFAQHLFWLLTIALISGMIAISVSMFRYSRKLTSVN